MSYQLIKEDIYEIIKLRKIKLDAFALIIYLRGKALQYGNPFYLSNKTICKELNITERIFNKIKKSLQEKGLLKYTQGNGFSHWTQYTLLDSIIEKYQHKGLPKRYPLRLPKGNPSNISIIDKKREKLKVSHFLPNDRMLIRSL